MQGNRECGPNRVLRFFNRIYCCGWQRLPRQTETLPDGPLILVGNHKAGVDPLLVQAAVSRPLSFLMAREYYTGMGLKWFFDHVGVVPVNPGGANRHAMRAALERVQQGGVLCIFPEGGANPPIPLHKIYPGAAVIAMETGAPILPFRITGVWPFDHVHISTSFLRRGRARVTFGELLHLPHIEGASRSEIAEGIEVVGRALRHVPRNGVNKP